MSDYQNISIPSSGDPDKDQRDLADARRHMALMDEGLCPNGCGPRIASADYEGGSECPKCGFFCNRPALDSEDQR